MWDETDAAMPDEAVPDAGFGLGALEPAETTVEPAAGLDGLGPLGDDVDVADGADPEALDPGASLEIVDPSQHAEAQAVAEELFERKRREIYGDYDDPDPDLLGLIDC